jgi:hypothetical protein
MKMPMQFDQSGAAREYRSQRQSQFPGYSQRKPLEAASFARNDAADGKIIALYREGKTPAEIVSITGRARHKVVHALHQAGLHLGTTQQVPVETFEEISIAESDPPIARQVPARRGR